MDIAIIPTDDVPARFAERVLYDEDFVIAMRKGHPFGAEPTLERFCTMQHLVVSLTGDAHGFVDRFLAKQGYLRRIALTVPNFMLALAVIAVVVGGVIGAIGIAGLNAAKIHFNPPGVAGGMTLLLVPNAAMVIAAAGMIFLLTVIAAWLAIRQAVRQNISVLLTGSRR